MSVPNPFSTSNAPHHNLVSKVVGGSSQAYGIAVDLVDIDTAYIRQLGTTLAPVQDIHLGSTFYWSGNPAAFVPPLPGGGVGPTGATGNTPQVVGGTGITASYSGITTTITNTGVVSVVPGFGISVVPVIGGYQQFQISYVGGTTGAGPPGPTGPTGAGLTGPPTQILYYSSTGVTSNPELTYDGVLHAPAIDIGTSSLVKIESIGGDSSIQSGLVDVPGSGNLLTIGKIGGTGTVVIDTIQSFVGINRTPRVALDVAGQTIMTYGVTGTTYSVVVSGSTSAGYTLAPSTTYYIQGWGAGGASSGGAGGAGGFAGITLTTDASPHGISWSNQYGGTGGGGNALVLYYDGTPIVYVPGGGAGNTGGTGAAAGETYGLPYPEGGYSSGYLGSAIATYTSNTPWKYDTLADIGITGGTFTSGTVYGIAGNAISGMTLTFSPAAPFQVYTIGVGTTYTTYPGTTFTINVSSLEFFSSVVSSTETGFVLPNGFAPIVDNGVASGLLGSTGTALYDPWPGVTYPSFIGNPTLFGTTGLTGSTGTVTTGPFNLTFVSGSTDTWFFAGTVTEFSPNAILGITAGTTFSFSVPSLGLTGITMTTTGTITIPTGTDIYVAERTFVNHGQTATDQNGVNNGGGGATGGGSSALVTGIPGISDNLVIGTTYNMPAGGGAGSWYIDPPYTGITLGGSGINPYTNQFNSYAQYGYGGTTGGGGSAFLVVQATTIGASTPALTVNGTLSVSSGVRLSSSVAPPGVGVVVGSSVAAPFDNESLRVTNKLAVGGATEIGGVLTVDEFSQLGAVFQSGAGQGVLIGVGSNNNNDSNDLTVTGNITVNGGTGGGSPGGRITFGPSAAYLVNQNIAGVPNILANVASIAALSIGSTQVTSFVDVYAPDFIATSDIRTKNSIVTVDSALDKVMKMRGVFFERNTEPGERRVGVIAQEVEEILPEVVHTDKDGMKSVSYGNIIGLLIEAIKEQQEVIGKFIHG